MKIQLFEIGAYVSDFCLWGWMKSEVYKEKSKHKRRIGRSHYEYNAVLIKQEHQNDFRRATRAVAKRVEKCTEVEGGIFEHLL